MTYKIQIDNIVRDATAEEAAAIDAQQAETKAQAEAEASKLAAKESAVNKLKALGLSEAEVSALLGL